MSIAQEIFTRVDLSTGLTIATQRAALMQGDKNANRMTAAVFEKGEKLPLAGMTASGQFIRPDGVTVPLEGKIDGNTASVTFGPSCYTVEGSYRAMLFLSIGEESRTIMEISGQIHDRGGDKILDVENIVPSVSDIVAQYAEMKAVTERTLAAGTSAAGAASAASKEATNANKAAASASSAANNANNAAAKIDGMTASATKGDNAGVKVSEKNGAKHLDFTLPKGDTGATPDIRFEVETGPAGTDVKLEQSGTAENPVIRLTIPRGDTGNINGLDYYEGTPKAAGTASPGSANGVSRGDHVHPFPKRIKHASSNAYAELRMISADRTKSVSMIDPDMDEEVDLYIARDTGKPSIRYKGAGASVVFHALYSSLNKPTAGDVGAIPTAGGTATGLIKAPNFVLGNETDYPSIGFQGLNASGGQLGAIQFSAPSDGRRFSFIQYPSDQDGKASRYLESYRLPKPASGLTKTNYYDIYTTKNPPTASDVGAATASHTHQTLKKTGGNSQDMQLGMTDTDKLIGMYVGGAYSATDSTTARMGIHVDKDTGVISARVDSKAGTWYPTFYTTNNKPTPADIGGFVGCHEVSVTSESIAAGQTGTASVTFAAISGATKYYAVLCTNGTVWGYVSGVTISGTTLKVTFYNSSTGAHTIGAKLLIIGVK